MYGTVMSKSALDYQQSYLSIAHCFFFFQLNILYENGSTAILAEIQIDDWPYWLKVQDTGPVLAREHVILLVSPIPYKIHGYDEVWDFCDLGVLPCLQNLIVSWGANFACLALIKAKLHQLNKSSWDAIRHCPGPCLHPHPPTFFCCFPFDRSSPIFLAYW